MTTKKNARELAYFALAACRKDGGWSDGVLKDAMSRAQLSGRDAALATRLCYGVLQNTALLDFWIAEYCTIKTEKLEPQILDILRLGVYQMAFMDKIPHSAAVNEAVEMARRHSNPRAAGLVNAVLRAASREADHFPEPPREDIETYLSIRYSHPLWYVKEMCLTLGNEGAECLLAANNGQPPISVQVNSLITTPEQAVESLERDAVTVAAHPWLPGCLELTNTGNLERLSAYSNGSILVQDPAARLAVLAAGLKPGNAVLDGCAAPGGKSFAAAQIMENRGSILSCDIHPHKLKLLENGAKRLGIHIIQTALQNGKQSYEEQLRAFDVVLADVPCSGMGIIRKKPDIRYKDPRQLTALPAVQLALLSNLSTYVKPGGVLLYSTCTVLSAENEGVVEAFLSEHPEFCPEAFSLPAPIGAVTSGRLTLWPHIHGTDGFFICRLRKVQ